jgi:hypothetical protein
MLCVNRPLEPHRPARSGPFKVHHVIHLHVSCWKDFPYLGTGALVRTYSRLQKEIRICTAVSSGVGHIRRLGKIAKCFVMSVRPHGTTRLPLDGFSWILIFGYFSKICRENSSLIKKLIRIMATLHYDQYTILIISFSILLIMINVSDKLAEKFKILILYSVTFFFRISCPLWDNVENYYRVGQATDDNMAHAHCMLDT